MQQNPLKVSGTALAAGSYQIYLKATDTAGNIAYQAFTFTVTDAPSTPPPTSTTEIVGGVAVVTTTETDSSGKPIEVVSVPIVPEVRADTGAPIQSISVDLLRDSDGSALLRADLPVGFGLRVEGPTGGPQSPSQALLDLTDTLSDRFGDGSVVQFATDVLGSLSTNIRVILRSIVPSVPANRTGTPEKPIVISAPAGVTGTQEALVFDLRNLPVGAVIELENIEFAAVIGNATLIGGAGEQFVYGDVNQQYMYLGAGDDVLHGGGGNDTVASAGGNDTLFGDEGDDVVMGGEGDDVVMGGEGADLISGGTGNDSGFGGLGNDPLQGGTGDDLLHGDEGIDSVRVEANFADVLIAHGAYGALTMSSAALGTDRMDSVEILRFNDQVVLVNAPTGIISDTGASEISETLYLARNPDVAQAVARGEFASGMDHYQRYGAAEGRLQPVALDGAFYLSQNADVAKAVSAGHFTSGLQHYLLYGEREGRDPNALFDSSWYLEYNADVATALQAGTIDSAYEHYVTFGWKEGRTPSAWMDTNAYLTANPDVAAAGVDPMTHYLNFGAREGRSIMAVDTGLWLI